MRKTTIKKSSKKTIKKKNFYIIKIIQKHMMFIKIQILKIQYIYIIKQ
jgi:hypothetical protein